MKKKYIVTLCFLSVFGISIWFFGPRVFSEFYTVQTIALPNGSEIVISAESYWEYSQCLVYQIKKGDMISHHQFIGSTIENTDSLEFDLVVADEGSIVGIVEKYRPDVILLLMDLESNRSREQMVRAINVEKNGQYILVENVNVGDLILPKVMQ